MTSHNFNFGKVILLQENIAEVIIYEGVEITLAMVNEYHDFLLKNLRAPFSILVNKIHSYTYSFEAQTKILNFKELHALGVVSYTYISELSTMMLHSQARDYSWNLKIFKDREIAYEWLLEQHEIS